MATPYRTPRYPRVPHPTPHSVSSRLPSSLRPPIHNPYDKFTQPEFDAWIDGLKGALKRALGQEEILPAPQNVASRSYTGDISAYAEEDLEDSFAEVKARRAAKGKERACEEDLEEEEREVEQSIISSDEDVGEEHANDWSGRPTGHPVNSNEDYQGDTYEEEEEEYDEEEAREAANGNEVIELSSDEEAGPATWSQPPVANEDEDDEDDEEAEGEEYDEYDERSSPVIDEDVPDNQMGASQPVSQDVQYISDEDEEAFPPNTVSAEQRTEVPDPWAGPNTYAEDFYSGGDFSPGIPTSQDPHVLPTEGAAANVNEQHHAPYVAAKHENSFPQGILDDRDILPEEIVNLDGDVPDEQNEEEDVFPPRSHGAAEPITIADPWEKPRIFAEDLYAGGELRENPAGLTPFHLTPQALTPGDADESFTITPGVVTPIENKEAEEDVHEEESPPIDGSDDVEDQERPSPAKSHTYTRHTSAIIEEQEYDDSRLEDLYDELDADEGESKEPYFKESNERGASPSASPSKSSRRMVLHERGSSPPRMSPGGHVDWNYPPAFPGRTVKGRSDRSDPFEVGDIFATSHERQAHHEEQEILEISDDEEEDELDEGPLPLGTSDLDIAPNVDNTLSDDELDANHDTEDVGSEDRERTPQHDRTQVEEASSREESIPVLQDPRDLTVVEDPQTYAGLESMYMQTDEYADEADIEETAQDAKSSFEPVDVNADFGYLPSPRVDHDLPDQSQILEVIANAASQEGPVQSVATSGNDVPGDELKDVSMPADPAKIDDVDTTEQPHNAVEESTDKAHVEDSADSIASSREASPAREPVPAQPTEDTVLPVEDVVEEKSFETVEELLSYPEEPEAEEHGTFTMPDIIPEDEVLDNALHERENTIDIESVATEAAAQLSSIVDYAVDEVASEGRRTLEPETGPSDAQAYVQEVLSQDSSLPVVETNGEDGSSQQSTTHPILSQAETLVAAEEGKTRKAWVMDVPDESELSIMVGEPVNDVLEYAVEDPSVSSPEYTVEELYDSAAPPQYTVEEPSDEDSPKVETAPSIPKEDEADVEALPVISVAEEGDVATPEDAVPATKGESVPRELESGVPMPVSADPDVPDPTSIVGTPGTSTPGSDADAGITSGTAGHLFPANLLKTTATRSGSGLFTPLYDGVISPASSDNPVNTGTASSVDGGAELEQAPSEPPASQVPDINEKSAVPNLEAEETLSHPQTQANALSIHPQEDLFATPVENTADSKDAEVHDIDADGDIDSDYEQPVEDLRSTPELSTANVSQAAEPSEQADIVTPADSPSNTLAPEDATVEGAVNEDVIEETTPEPSRLKDTEYASDVSEAMRAMPPPKQVSETEDAKEAATNQEDKSEERDEIRPLKRKRTPSPAAPRLTRSMSMGRSRIPLPTRSRKGKGKEKAKANEQSSEDDRDESNSVTSSLGAEALLLADHTQSKSSTPMSRGTSRASSVLSSVASGPSELSPIEHLERPQPPPRSLSDIQALLRHHHGNASRPLLLQREPSRREPPRQEPLPQESPAVPVKPNSSVNTPAATPPPLAESSGNTDEAATNIGLSLPVAASTSTITFSPRVGTRSNCRYHKISLPGEGDRPRIFFLVPACSLSNIEFMKEEDIQDHGLATEEDGRNMLYDIDIESLGISLYLVGTLRQLVGVDLIREREVFYLPQAGEFIQESTKRKSRRRQSHRDSISSRTIAGTNLSTATATQRIPGASRSPAKAPRSKADSISTVGSSIPWGSQRSDRRSESVSASISMKSMSDNEEEKPAKRRRGPKPKNAEASGSAAPSSTAPHNTPSNGASTSKDADTKPKVRRSRRLGTDAAAYKPEENPSETSENEAPSRRVANRKGGAIRGTKRGRTVEEKPGDDGAQASKRRKVHVRTASSLPVKKKK